MCSQELITEPRGKQECLRVGFSVLYYKDLGVSDKKRTIGASFKFFSHKLALWSNTRRINAHSFRNDVNEAVQSKRKHD